MAKEDDLRVLDQREAAKILDMSTRTLEGWRWEGKGPRYVKLGRSVRYRLADLLAFLDQNTREAR